MNNTVTPTITPYIKQNTVAPPRQGSKLYAATPRSNSISRRRSAGFTTWNAPWQTTCPEMHTIEFYASMCKCLLVYGLIHSSLPYKQRTNLYTNKRSSIKATSNSKSRAIEIAAKYRMFTSDGRYIEKISISPIFENSNLISISKFNIDAFDMINISSHNNR